VERHRLHYSCLYFNSSCSAVPQFLFRLDSRLFDAYVMPLDPSELLLWNDTYRIVVVYVDTAAEISLEVRIHRKIALHFCTGVSHCQTDAAPLGAIGGRTVNHLVVMERNLAGLKHQ